MSNFKIGDWVVSKHTNEICRCIKIDKLEFQDDLGSWHICTSYKVWQPKEGELIINKGKNDIITIEKYTVQTEVYPFIGEITWLHKTD